MGWIAGALAALFALEAVSHTVTKRLVQAQRDLIVSVRRLNDTQAALIIEQRRAIELRDEHIAILTRRVNP